MGGFEETDYGFGLKQVFHLSNRQSEIFCTVETDPQHMLLLLLIKEEATGAEQRPSLAAGMTLGCHDK